MNTRRSILSVPGHIEKMHLKALNSNADCIQFDLEDSVPNSEKNNALLLIQKNINEGYYKNKKISMRINQFNSEFSYNEILGLVEVSDKLDFICVPKVETANDIIFIDKYLSIIEKQNSRNLKIKIDVSIETAKGFENIESIVKSSNRISALVFGVADYTRSVRGKNFSLSGHGEEDLTDFGYRWSWAIGRLVNIAKANNFEAIDAPFGNFSDIEQLKKISSYGAFIGLSGKWAIHPIQIDIINQCFGYSQHDINNANLIKQSFEYAQNNNLGAISVNEKMIDIASYNIAVDILKCGGK